MLDKIFHRSANDEVTRCSVTWPRDFNAAAKKSLDLTHCSDIDFENVSPNGKVNTVLTPC